MNTDNLDISRAIGDTLRAARIKRGLTQTQLAELSNTSRSTIAQTEKSGRELQPLTAARLANALGIDPAELCREIQPTNPVTERAQELKQWIANAPQTAAVARQSASLNAGQSGVRAQQRRLIPWWTEALQPGQDAPPDQQISDVGYVLRKWSDLDFDGLRIARIQNDDNAPTLKYYDHALVSLTQIYPVRLGLYYLQTPNGLLVRRLTPQVNGRVRVSADAAVAAENSQVDLDDLDIRAVILAGFCWRYIE